MRAPAGLLVLFIAAPLQAASPVSTWPLPPYATCTASFAEETGREKGVAGLGDICVTYWLITASWLTPESFDKACNGIKPYPDPQPPGIPATLAECERDLPQTQHSPMTEAQKAAYRATWKSDGPQNYR